MEERNFGLDLLRGAAMLQIICIHILEQGGVLGAEPAGSFGAYFASFLFMAVYCGVDCFVLLSGYAGFRNRVRLSRLLRLWAGVIFWSVVISCVFFLVKPETRTVKEAVSMFLPLLRGRYWFFTAYVVLFFSMPALNHLIRTLPRNTFRLLLFALLAVFGLVPVLSLGYDVLRLSAGHHFAWLMAVYLTGGYLGRYHAEARNPRKCFLAFWGFAAAHLLYKILAEQATRLVLGTPMYGELFLTYMSPFVLGEAVCLLLGFRSLRIPGNSRRARCIAAVTPAIFSVYIIHVHPLLFWDVLPGLFAPLAAWNPLWMAAAVLGTALCVFAVCAALDAVRSYLFRILRVGALCDRLGERITALAYRICRIEREALS